MSLHTKYSLIATAWLTAVLRLPGLFHNTFHADEALFASWARLIAVWRDPLLLTQAVDKPPLLFYLQALFYPLQGPEMWAARLPTFIASVLLAPLAGVLAWRLYRDEGTAVLSALFIALLPLAIQFSGTAFTDPLLVFWLVGVLSLQVAGGRRQVAGAGVLFGLAVATKHQAWLFLPLIVGFGRLDGWGRRAWVLWLAGFLPLLGLLLAWDWLRTGTLTLWTAQVSNFGGIRPVWSWELGPRLGEWLSLWQTAVSLPFLILLALAILFLLPRSWRQPSQTAAFDMLLVLLVLGYMLLHWLLAIPVWDRYLLPLLPLVAILAARTLRIASVNIGCGLMRMNVDGINKKLSAFSALSAVFLLFLLPSAIAARNGRLPIGGQPGADQGAAQIAEFLADAPYGTVLYDHWYSWQWRYHLFDKRVFVSWFPHGQALAQELAVFGDDGYDRYLALPDTAVAHPVYRVVWAAGFDLQPAASAGDIRLFLLVSE